MARNSALNFNLPSADDLFSTEEERVEARLEKVVNLSPAEISDFPNHPFKVRMDAAMQEMAESVKQYGVLVPTLVRPKPGGGYEMVAGHRRKKAADLAGLTEIPCIVRQLTDDEATIIMVDSNLQREQILPSEKAFAYKMKLDAMKRQAGRPSKENSVPLGHHSIVGKSRELLATNSPDSNTQIQRYVRLTHLIPEILELADNSVLKDPDMLQIALRPAVELSYLRKEEQADLFARKLARNFGEAYSLENIRRRILAQSRPQREQKPEPKQCRLHGDLKQAKKATGFRALYFHYCYLLGVFPKKQNRQTGHVPHALREDLIRAEELTDEARLLSRHRIDTLEQLNAYQADVESRLSSIMEQRKSLYRKQRTRAVLDDPAQQEQIRTEIATLTAQIKELRREVKLCGDIALRSVSIKDKIRAAREEQQAGKTEKGRLEPERAGRPTERR